MYGRLSVALPFLKKIEFGLEFQTVTIKDKDDLHEGRAELIILSELIKLSTAKVVGNILGRLGLKNR